MEEHEKEMLHDHEIRLTDVEKNQSKFNDELVQLGREIREGNIRTEENNKYLREQNVKILDEVLKRNDMSEQRKHEITMLDKNNWWKLVLMIFGSAGTIVVILELVFKFKGGN